MITKINQETARSMTEMLGTLTIMGVLGIGAISAYSFAMNKYRAIEVMTSLNKMAVAGSQQMELTGRPGLSEFQNRTSNGYRVDVDSDGETFTLTVRDVPKPVCKNILDAEWTLPWDVVLYSGAAEIDSCEEGTDMAFVFTRSLNAQRESSGGPGSGHESTGMGTPPAAAPESTMPSVATPEVVISSGTPPLIHSCRTGKCECSGSGFYYDGGLGGLYQERDSSMDYLCIYDNTHGSVFGIYEDSDGTYYRCYDWETYKWTGNAWVYASLPAGVECMSIQFSVTEP